MVTLINTSKNYSVTKETENFKLSGNAVVIDETSTITSFNGTFNTINGEYSGNFNYGETETGKANKNIYDVDKANFVELDTLLDGAIQDLKNEL